MKIQRLHINGFGVFHDKAIKGFQQGINVLYGPNEAGKSTLLDFIRFTLFEYPRSIVSRRPPLSGGNHGGRIWLEDRAGQPLSISRNGNGKDVQFWYKGQPTTDITLYRQLIGNASLDLYQNMYAITLDELVRVDQLEDSGMEGRIFSMGMGLTGVDFGSFEKELNAHADTFFIARGRIQILPDLVNKIQEKEAAIHKLQNKLGEYNRLSEEKEQLEKEIQQVQEERDKANQARNTFSNYEKAYPDFVKYQEATVVLDETGDIHLHPVHILEEHKTQKQKLVDRQETLQQTNQKLQQLEKERASLSLDITLSENSHLLDDFKSNVKGYEAAIAKNHQEKDNQSKAAASINSIIKRIGNDVSFDKLINLEGTFDIQARSTQTVNDQQKTEQRIDTKKDVENRLAKEVNQLESRIDIIEQELHKNSIQNLSDREEAHAKRVELDTAFQKALTAASAPQTGLNRIPVILTVLFLIVGGVLFFVHLLAGAIVSGIALICLLILLFTTKSTSGISTGNPNEINKEIDHLKSAVETFDRLNKDRQEIERQLKDKKATHQQITQDVDSLKKLLQTSQDEWGDLLHEKQLPPTLTPQSMGDFISQVEELKRQQQTVNEAAKTIQKNEKLIQDFEEKIRTVAPEQEVPDLPFIYNLIRRFEENERTKTQKAQIKKEILQRTQEKETIAITVENLKTEMNTQFKTLGVADEIAFYHHFEQQQKYQEALDKQAHAAGTIKTLCGADQLESTLKVLQEFTPAELNNKKIETDSQYETLKNQYDDINRELATKTTEIRHILKPDEMYDLQNQQESLETELKEAAKEWFATKLALEILNESKQKYEKERQPEVIRQTRQYFQEITENAYTDLRISLSEKHVSIIDKDGKSKTVEELSRGTREQLLLALRFGLIEEYEKNAEPLPVAFDDILVNSDTERTQKLIKILSRFASNRQVLYFTCHQHTKDLFAAQGANIISW